MYRPRRQVPRFEIHFFPSNVYAPGQAIIGQVLLDVAETISVSVLTLLISGEARVKWKDDKGVNVEDQEPYLNEKFVLIGTETQQTATTLLMATDCVSETLMQPTCLLNPGRHIFNFECTLPTRLAPSYTSGFGAVRYRAVASMLRPTGQNYEVESPVIIRPHDHMDLNDVPSAAQESETSGEKYFRRCCCRGGAVLVTASVSHAGCAIGMSLALSVQVDNNSRREAKAAVHLIKTEAFTTGSHSKECCTTVHTVSRPGLVGPHSEVADVVVIPFNATLKPSNHLDACQLMTLSYLLEVKVGISGADKPLLIQLPVVVGTHPLKVASATPAEQRALKHMRAKMSALSLNGKPRVAAPASSSSSTTTTFTPITSASSPEFRVLLTSAPPLARSTHSSTPPRSDHSSHSNTPPIVSHRPRAPTWN